MGIGNSYAPTVCFNVKPECIPTVTNLTEGLGSRVGTFDFFGEDDWNLILHLLTNELGCCPVE